MRSSESPPQVIKRSFAGLNKLLITPVRELITPFKIASSVLITKSLKTQKENIINAPNLVMEGMIIHHLSVRKLA